MAPDEVAEALPTIRQRCEEIGRHPATLAVSGHLWAEHIATPGQARVDRLSGYAALGLSRAIGLIRATTTRRRGAATVRRGRPGRRTRARLSGRSTARR